MNFANLGISPQLLKRVDELGFTEPTPIQKGSVPPALEGEDILGIAETGSGKTAAFVLPMIQQIERFREKGEHRKGAFALILSPTRELATQIQETIDDLQIHPKVKSVVLVGGVSQHGQVQKIKAGVDVIVATPGRLVDLMTQGLVRLGTIEYFVLDEADRMLDLGFKREIDTITSKLPRNKQTLLFSATMPDSIRTMSERMLRNPILVELASKSHKKEQIEQQLYLTNRTDKKDLLLHILENPEIEQVLVFTRTKHGADRLCRHLVKKKVKADAIHGDKRQNARDRALSDFKENRIRVLVATDVASRGIDIQALGYVINYEIPNEPEIYVHRIGRVGRAGLTGVAISIAEPEELVDLRNIEKHQKQSIVEIKNHPFPQTDKPMTVTEKKEFNKQKNLIKLAHIKNRRENANKKARPKRKS